MLQAKVIDLEAVYECDDATVLERTVAFCLLKGLGNGDLTAFALLGQIAYSGQEGEMEDGIDLNSPIKIEIKRNKNTPKLARGEHEIPD